MMPDLYVVGPALGRLYGWIGVANINVREHLSMKSVTRGNSGSSDGGNSWDDRGPVVMPKGTKGSSQGSNKPPKPTGLEALIAIRSQNKEYHEYINTKVMDILVDVDILVAAYAKIKSKKSNMTPGTINQTLDGLDIEWFKLLSKQLSTGEFQFKPSRRILIPKPNGGTRPLGIASPRDKIVQEALRMVLEAVFEDSFSVHSHGFRAGKSCHTALKEIKHRFGSVSWFIEGDIRQCFDSFDHRLLVTAVATRIRDQAFLDLIYKALKAGYINPANIYLSLDKGTPQGSIVSPILCNIYLHALDKMLEEYTATFDKGNRRRHNPEYTRLARGYSKLDKESRRLRLKYIHENRIRLLYYSDTSFKRMRFVRYADDILIGVIGSKEDCIKIRDDLALFLKEKLNLTLSSKITHATYDKAFFLGTNIRITPYEKKPIRYTNRLGDVRITKVSTRPQLLAPIRRIVERLTEKGFCRKGIVGWPTRVGKFIHYPLDVVYNIVLGVARGYLNYYSFASNYARLRKRILFILKYSLALTLANKFKLRTLRKTFRKYGYDLQVTVDNKNLKFDENIFPKSAPGFRMDINYNPFAQLRKLLLIIPRTRSLLKKESSCAVCGSLEKLEVHHVRHIRKAGRAIQTIFLTSLMSRMNRKQIVICQKCHHLVHRGMYDGIKLRALNRRINPKDTYF
jgi:group II intron reverse transcriptase/maturase